MPLDHKNKLKTVTKAVPKNTECSPNTAVNNGNAINPQLEYTVANRSILYLLSLFFLIKILTVVVAIIKNTIANINANINPLVSLSLYSLENAFIIKHGVIIFSTKLLSIRVASLVNKFFFY